MPLSPAFPIPELQYVLDHSEASLLVSSTKFLSKADQVLSSGLATPPKRIELLKHQGGAEHEAVPLEDADASDAGMMLYTSGTTNRPVREASVLLLCLIYRTCSNWPTERSPAPSIYHHGAMPIP